MHSAPSNFQMADSVINTVWYLTDEHYIQS